MGGNRKRKSTRSKKKDPGELSDNESTFSPNENAGKRTRSDGRKKNPTDSESESKSTDAAKDKSTPKRHDEKLQPRKIVMDNPEDKNNNATPSNEDGKVSDKECEMGLPETVVEVPEDFQANSQKNSGIADLKSDGIKLQVTAEEDEFEVGTSESERDSDEEISESESSEAESYNRSRSRSRSSDENSVSSRGPETSEDSSEESVTEQSTDSEPSDQARYQNKRSKGRKRTHKKERSRHQTSKRRPAKQRKMRIDRKKDTTAEELLKLKAIQNNPEMFAFVKDMVKREKGSKTKPGCGSGVAPSSKKDTTNKKGQSSNKRLESPSNITLYAPLLNKSNDKKLKSKAVFTEDGINRILSSLRLNQSSVTDIPGLRREDESRSERFRSKEFSIDPTEGRILEAEKQKAAIAAPKQGRNNLTPDDDVNAGPCEGGDLYYREDDDDCMVVDCHLDDTTKTLIKKGGFVEVSKLRPKDLNDYEQEDEKIELVKSGGMTYYLPSKPKTHDKINNIKKWDEGFRVYVSIYSQANPSRASEIIQYVHTIHNAAKSFIWENVAKYDYIFRQKMAKRPSRSWARINAQLWSLSMVTPMSRNFGHQQGTHGNGSHGQSGGQKQDLRKICCWRYNRNKCTRQDCKFEHRCSFCGSSAHIYLGCPKRPKNKGKGETKKATTD